jgi:chromosome segregation ATPase
MLEQLWLPRQALLAVLVSMLFIPELVGCDGGRVRELEFRVDSLRAELHEARDRLKNVRDKLDDVQSKMQTLKSDIEEASDAVDDFDYYDWRSVVPDVRSGIENARADASELENSIRSAIYEMD